MKHKLLLLFLVMTTIGFAQTLYSADDNSLFGDSGTKKGIALYGDGDDDDEGFAPDPTDGVGAPDPGTDIPLGEGLFSLIALTGVYLLIKNKTKKIL
jgi:hypothetical protein